MSYKELFAMDAEALNTKYKEVFGKNPPADLTKQGIASALSKQEGDNSNDNDNQNDNSKESLGNDLAAITEERDVLKAENIELKNQIAELKSGKKDAAPKLKYVPEEKLIHLEKGEGATYETNTVTEAVWNNLPLKHKSGWKVKEPGEVKSNS